MKTITVGSSSATAGADGANLKGADENGSKLSGGSIAGVVVGVVGGLALVGALIFLVFFYRKRAARASSPTPSQDMADRHSQGSGFSHGVFPQGQGGAGSSLGRQTTFTDNRMKNTIYPNGRRDSSVSLQDNEDYSRPVLRVRNVPRILYYKCTSYVDFINRSPTPTKLELDFHPRILPTSTAISTPLH